MKTKLYPYIFTAVFALALAFGQTATAQTVEEFSYPSGTLLTGAGWTALSGTGTNNLTVTAGSLLYTGTIGTGIGNKVSLANNGQDVYKTITTISSGSAYGSALVNVSAAQATGDYVYSLGTAASQNARVYIKSNGAGGFVFGVAREAGTPVYEATARSFNTTYFIVVKETIVAGTTNDVVSLFVNPATGGTEPGATITYSATGAGTGADPASISAIVLTQGTAANAATLTLDGIAEGTTWASVTSAQYDFGDAPYSPYEYNNAQTADAPARNMPSATLMLGTTATDAETGPYSISATVNAPATANNSGVGDNANGSADEDGITGGVPPGIKDAYEYDLPVKVLNNTGGIKTLYGWIDFNRNGILEATEVQTFNVPSSASAQTDTLKWTSTQTRIINGTGNLYMRLRISSATLADNASTATVDERSIADGASTGNGSIIGAYGTPATGEVEDYLVPMAYVDVSVFNSLVGVYNTQAPASGSNTPTFAANALASTANNNIVASGGSVRFEVRVMNTGLTDLTNVVLTVPAVSNFTATSVTDSVGPGQGAYATGPTAASLTVANLATGITIPFLPTGSTVNFIITGTAGACGNTISNCATATIPATAGFTEISTSNNSDCGTVNIASPSGTTAVYEFNYDSTYNTNTAANGVTASSQTITAGGTVNFRYVLISGTAVPGIGNSFTVPVTYGNLNNYFAGTTDNWQQINPAALPNPSGLRDRINFVPDVSSWLVNGALPGDLTTGTFNLRKITSANSAVATNQNLDSDFVACLKSYDLLQVGFTIFSFGSPSITTPGNVVMTQQALVQRGVGNSGLASSPTGYGYGWDQKFVGDPTQRAQYSTDGGATENSGDQGRTNFLGLQFIGKNFPYKYTAQRQDNSIGGGQNRGYEFMSQITFVWTSISGTVWKDSAQNGVLVAANVTNAGGTLYANLVDATTNQVVQSVAVASNGTYTFTQYSPNYTYNIILSSGSQAVGSTLTKSTAVMPSGWSNVSTNINGTPNATDTSGQITLTTPCSGNTTGQNFGLEQLPKAGSGSNTALNPGGTTQATVPASTFTNITSSLSNAPTASIDSILINAFPTGATSITINGTNYTSSTWPAAGVKILASSTGSPIPAITVDPAASGATTVTISFLAIDTRHHQSRYAGTATMNFTALTISGNVYNDANGLTNSKVDGTGTNAGGLTAVLTDTATGKVVATATVSAGGTYTFTNLDSIVTYKAEITTNTATVGSAPPAVALPTGWISTGEHLGSGTGSDNKVDGQLAIGPVTSAGVSNANFGIVQCSAFGLAITANASKTLYCASTVPTPSAVTLTSTPSGGLTPYASYLWTGSGVSPANTQNTSATPTTSGNYTVTLTDALGCTATGTTALVTYDNTTPSISPNCSGGGASLQLIEINGVSWIWTTTSGGRFYTDASYSVNSDSDVSHLQAPFIKKAGNYTVQMVDANGCSSSATSTITTSSCSVLASSMTGLSAQRTGNTVALQWQAANSAAIKEFIVERSTDGNNFIIAGKVPVTNNSSYHFDDDVSSIGCIKLYYRIQETGTDNSSYTSNTVPVNCNGNDASQYVLNIYPNPVISGSKLTVSYSLPASVTKAQIVVTNVLSGQQYGYVLSNAGNGVNNTTIPVSSMAAGTYFVRIISDKWISKTIKIIKQ